MKMTLIYCNLSLRSNSSLIRRHPEGLAVKLNTVYMFIVNEIQKCKNLIHIIDDHFGQGKDQIKINIKFMFSDIVDVHRMLRELKKLTDTRTASSFKGFIRKGR